MNRLHSLDAAAIAGLEKLAHAIQRRTGKTNYWLLRQALVLEIIAIVFMIIKPRERGGLLMGALLAFLYLFMNLLPLYMGANFTERWEKRAFERLAQGLANPLKESGRRDRVIKVLIGAPALTVMSTLLSSWLYIAAGTLALLSLYLVALDPLPPGGVKNSQAPQARPAAAPT
jgi:hypothetical protein